MKILKQFAENIWIVKRPLTMLGVETGTMMTVIRLTDGNLFIHSPVKLSEDLRDDLQSLGIVKYIVSPNKLHHLFMGDYPNVFPEAKLYALSSLINKRPDLTFEKVLTDIPEAGWEREIDQVIFKGSIFLEEMIFLHKPSGVLIVTDLIQGYDADKPFFTRCVTRLLGTYMRRGIPRDLMLTIRNKEEAYQNLKTVLDWNFDKVLFCHADPILDNGKNQFRELVSCCLE